MFTVSKEKSKQLYNQARNLMPGGVNSPVRAFKSVNSEPIFIKSAKGSQLFDVDGNAYVDYIGSWGPMILGHADPDVEAALIETIKQGTSYGAPTEIENLMAEEVISLVPSVEMVRMVNSGTEAVMGALRLARAYTKRNKIVKFSGCYHGHADAMLVQAGSGVATLGLPDSPGVTKEAAANTITVNYNDKEALTQVFAEHGDDIAAVITEPVIGNSGCITPLKGYLEFLREITTKHGALLIFDEVMTGFRVALGGAQALYNVMPDITTLGKIIGAGLPVGAYGGRKEIMEMVAPSGPMYQAGTLSGNPLAMTAGLTCLRKIKQEGFYQELENKVSNLIDGIKAVNQELGFNKMHFAKVGAMFGMFFTKDAVQGSELTIYNDGLIKNYDDAKNCDLEFFKKYHAQMLEHGIYLAPSAFEAGFMSAAHSDADIQKTIDAHKKSLTGMGNVVIANPLG